MAGIVAQVVVRIEPDDAVQVRLRRPGADSPTALWIRTEGGGLVQLQFDDPDHLNRWLRSLVTACEHELATRRVGDAAPAV